MMRKMGVLSSEMSYRKRWKIKKSHSKPYPRAKSPKGFSISIAIWYLVLTGEFLQEIGTPNCWRPCNQYTEDYYPL